VSRHKLETDRDDGGKIRVLMNRTLYKRAGDDFLVLKVEFANIGETTFNYNYIYGDEPWVGEFGSSSGDIGWANRRTFKRESYLLPVVDNYAGFWDIGNDLAGEAKAYSGYANFVEWLANPPSIVYFSNSLRLNEFIEGAPLGSRDNRVINLLWLSEILRPRHSKGYVMALGMAKSPSRTELPKPDINFVKHIF
jgi:hypothetical protein